MNEMPKVDKRDAGKVHLAAYDNSFYHPGRSALVQALWFFIGLPILRCALIPSSGLRVWLLRMFGARVGSGVVIKPGARVKYPWHLTVGNNCWIGEDCWIDNLTTVTLGSDCCLSQACYLCTGNHNWSDPAFGLIVKPIHVGDSAWVGARAMLAPGVTLGTAAVAAAGSIVTKDIPAYEIHAGNPATLVKLRNIHASPDQTLIKEASPEKKTLSKSDLLSERGVCTH